MKKHYIVFAIVSLSLLLSACGSKSSNVNSKSENTTSAYTQFLENQTGRQGELYYYIKDIDKDTVEELILLKNTKLSIYTADETVTLIDSHDFITGTVRFFSSDNSDYPGIFYFTAGGSCERYGYITVKDKKLSFENLWEKNYATDTPEINELSENKALISESQKLYNNDCDISFIFMK